MSTMYDASTLHRLNEEAVIADFRAKHPDIELVTQDEADAQQYEAVSEVGYAWERVADDLTAEIKRLTARIAEGQDLAVAYEMAEIVNWASCQTGDL